MLRRLRRHSFSIVVVLVLTGLTALLYFAPMRDFVPSRSGMEREEEAVRGTSTAQRERAEEGNSSSQTTVSIYSEPSDASVIIEGDTVGITPLEDYSSEEGAYFVTVTKEGYSAEDTLLVLTRSRAAEIRAQLSRTSTQTDQDDESQEEVQKAEEVARSRPAPETSTPSPRTNETDEPDTAPATGTLQLRSVPESTAVTFNGEAVGRTPLRLDSVPSGSHELIFVRSGYERLLTQIEVTGGETRSMKVSLEPALSYLRILVEPWGSIFINEQPHARTTDVWYETAIRDGTHEISVTHPFLGKRVRTVETTPGDTLRVVFDLRKE